MEYQGRVELLPEQGITELRGFLKGINPEFCREEEGEPSFISFEN